MTMEGRIKRLERDWDHPANPGPDPETVAHWASLWTAAGLEESRAKTAALGFLVHCRSTGVMPAIGGPEQVGTLRRSSWLIRSL